MVENIAPSVTKSNIRALFAGIGPVEGVYLSFSALGNFRGSADVYMRYRKDAVFAVKRFHNQPLDRQRLSVTFIETPGVVVSKQQNDKNSRRKSKARQSKSKSKAKAKAEPTREDLDSEIAGYMEEDEPSSSSTSKSNESDDSSAKEESS